eukprot:scaffold19990_cov92-Skeletonema_menzelii.AAC.1
MDGKIAVASHLPLLAELIIFQSSFCQHDLLANHHVGHSPRPAAILPQPPISIHPHASPPP